MPDFSGSTYLYHFCLVSLLFRFIPFLIDFEVKKIPQKRKKLCLIFVIHRKRFENAFAEAVPKFCEERFYWFTFYCVFKMLWYLENLTWGGKKLSDSSQNIHAFNVYMRSDFTCNLCHPEEQCNGIYLQFIFIKPRRGSSHIH